ncbi:hypothetical protein QR680_007501 [Steinernema hermaphroditum]|uniref:Uncharacterized protein n=1 Tax=Steinernema hermaphroditum TaxID=289476 RepID=A0AA39IDC4_9BILA|nr:hypothetical protein QR680_007501 [Steinernema hermaphroditum]
MSPDDIQKVMSYSLTGLTYSFSLPFLYIVAFKSPPSMSVYRNTILNLAIWYCITMASYAVLFQPIYAVHMGKSCARFVGLASYFGAEVNVGVMFLSAISLENTAISILICFLCRLEQVRSTNKLSLMESYKGVFVCIALHIAVSIFAGCICYAILVFSELIEDTGTYLLCFDDRSYYMVKALVLLVAIAFIVGTVVFSGFAFITIKVLASHKALMTKSTYRLQRLLTINLIIILILPIVFDIIPICTLCYMIYVKSNSLYFWVLFADHAPFGDVIFTFLATLLFVTPYREAVKALLRITSAAKVTDIIVAPANRKISTKAISFVISEA